MRQSFDKRGETGFRRPIDIIGLTATVACHRTHGEQDAVLLSLKPLCRRHTPVRRGCEIRIYDARELGRIGLCLTLLAEISIDDDDSIEMQIPRAGEALAALKFCEENRK